MAVPSVDINLLAVLVAAVASMIIGGLWYSPLLFGKQWMKLSGMSKQKIKKAKTNGKVGRSYFISFLMTLVACYVLAHFVIYVTASTFADGAQLAFWAWLGFEVPLALNETLWGGKSFKLFVLNAAHHLVALVVAAGILATW